MIKWFPLRSFTHCLWTESIWILNITEFFYEPEHVQIINLQLDSASFCLVAYSTPSIQSVRKQRNLISLKNFIRLENGANCHSLYRLHLSFVISHFHSIYCLLTTNRPPLCYSTQSSWLQIQRFGFDSKRYHIFWEVVGLKRGPLGFVSTTEELLGRNSKVSGLEIREYGRRDP
jgi:hypothetical protein